MKYFSAFSGIGGFELGMPKDWECVGYSEIYEPAIKIYQKHFPKHKNYGDISTIIAENLPNFDLFVGGFPCQDLSIAGKRKGLSGSRSGLFFEILRILKVKRPTHILLENVRHLLAIGKGEAFKTILREISELGYDCEWALFYSSDFGKPQSRPRVYIKGIVRESTRQVNDGKRKNEKTPILFDIKTRFRNSNYNWEEIGRMSTRALRDYAGISISKLDGRITKNNEEISIGECDNARHTKRDL